jgi:CBS domain-containing protein
VTVQELMKTEVVTCAPTDTLATVAATMRDRRCGFMPVVNSEGTVVGVLTDRDVCLVAAEARRAMTNVAVRDTMSQPVFGCFPTENIKTILVTMARHHVRRLPVLNNHGHLQGVLSIDDIVQVPSQRGGATAEDIVTALKGICAARAIEAVSA